MTDEARFAQVLSEVHALLMQLGDLSSHVMVIGGQVIALHGLARRRVAAIETTTDTGVKVTRGFTNEPDLFFDIDEQTFGSERLVEVLRNRGYQRTNRAYCWGRRLTNGVEVMIDLFRPEELREEFAPTVMTPLRDAALITRRPEELTVELDGKPTSWRVPNAFAFMRTKVTAKLVHRPASTRDCFDLYVFLRLLGAKHVRATFAAAPDVARIQLERELRQLFWDENSPGVRDVVAEAAGLDAYERDLLIRDVIDLFAELL